MAYGNFSRIGGFLALCGWLTAAVAGSAVAAPLQIGGFTVDDEDAASSVITDSGSTEIFDKFHTGVATQGAAIGGYLQDGVRCVGLYGCSFTVGFDFDVVNTAGDDIIIAGLGTVPNGSEIFDLEIGGVTLNGLELNEVGLLGEAPLRALTIDLSAFGIAIGEAIRNLRIIVRAGINSEEFVYLGAYDDNVLVNPVPGAAVLFGTALAGAGLFGARRRKKLRG